MSSPIEHNPVLHYGVGPFDVIVRFLFSLPLRARSLRRGLHSYDHDTASSVYRIRYEDYHNGYTVEVEPQLLIITQTPFHRLSVSLSKYGSGVVCA